MSGKSGRKKKSCDSDIIDTSCVRVSAPIAEELTDMQKITHLQKYMNNLSKADKISMVVMILAAGPYRGKFREYGKGTAIDAKLLPSDLLDRLYKFVEEKNVTLVT